MVMGVVNEYSASYTRVDHQDIWIRYAPTGERSYTKHRIYHPLTVSQHHNNTNHGTMETGNIYQLL